MDDQGIAPGDDFASSIPAAIKKCSCFVLLLTPESQESRWIQKELKHAISAHKPVIPVQPKAFALNEAFNFLLVDCQILPLKTLDPNDLQATRFITAVKDALAGKFQKLLRNVKQSPKKAITIALIVVALLLLPTLIGNGALSDIWYSVTEVFSSSEPSPKVIDQIPKIYNDVILAAQHSNSSLREITVRVGEYTTTQASSVWQDCTIYSKDSRIAIGEGLLINGVSVGDTYVLVVSDTGSTTAYHVTVTE